MNCQPVGYEPNRPNYPKQHFYKYQPKSII
jgi:hypothetical protein